MSYKILIYVPNIIGYIRLLLLSVSWYTFHSTPPLSAITYAMSAALDCLDGCSARKLNQVTAFGAWFDIVIDNISRGMIWSRLFQLGYLVACVEWLCFVCTHSFGSQWKNAPIEQPWLVKQVMKNSYRSPLGIASIAGLHVLPIVLYTHYTHVLALIGIPHTVTYIAIGLLSAGRAVCMMVELWFIWFHVVRLLHEEESLNGHQK